MEERFVKLKYDYGLESKIFEGYELFSFEGVNSGEYDVQELLSILRPHVDFNCE